MFRDEAQARNRLVVLNSPGVGEVFLINEETISVLKPAGTTSSDREQLTIIISNSGQKNF